MKKMGLAMTPENRKEEGLVQVLSIRDNLSLASMEMMAVHGFLNKKDEDPLYRLGKSRSSKLNCPMSTIPFHL